MPPEPEGTRTEPMAEPEPTTDGVAVEIDDALAAAVKADQGSLLKVPFRLAATSVALGRQLTVDVAGRSWTLARDVVDGARNGRSPEELAGVVLEGWFDIARELLGAAATQVSTVSSAAPVGEIARTVGSQLSSQAATVTGRAGRDGADLHLGVQGRALLQQSAALDCADEHPAFRAIMRELAPDESRILCLLAASGARAMVDVHEYNPMTRNTREVARNVTLIGSEAGCLRPKNTPIYLDNLERLGLVHLRDYRAAAEGEYELLEAQPEVDELPEPEGRLTKHRILYRAVELSAFGQQFFQLCFAPTLDERPIAVFSRPAAEA